MATSTTTRGATAQGKLRIGDDWNAITIIALSQSNPLKAVAEFVENSIDAGATHVTIIRGKERGASYLRVVDDGAGLPQDAQGLPNFRYVATHICDSIKRQLKARGATGLQGEFGIGLLSFWVLGEELTLTCAGADGHSYQMRLRKGESRYMVSQKRTLLTPGGTELMVRPLLAGVRNLSGERLQWYLAAELRDRIRSSGVKIRIIDRQTRAHYDVVPRQFEGMLLRELPAVATPHGTVYVELYLVDAAPEHRVWLCRQGTRVLEDISALEAFGAAPWNSGLLQGMIDAPFLHLTPGTRTGVVQEEAYAAFCAAMEPVVGALKVRIDAWRQVEDERMSRQLLRSIHHAFQEALTALPAEEYSWFDVPGARDGRGTAPSPGVSEDPGMTLPLHGAHHIGAAAPLEEPKRFFEFPGPLFRVTIAPASCTLPVGGSRSFRVTAWDRKRLQVHEGLTILWRITEGDGALEHATQEVATFQAPNEPGLIRLCVEVKQGDAACNAEALMTVTDSLLPELPVSHAASNGLPAYTFERAPGELRRSRYDPVRNVIIINNAHRDYVFASKQRVRKLRYLCRLYAKELVQANFVGLPTEQLLERMVELSLYAEEHLR